MEVVYFQIDIMFVNISHFVQSVLSESPGYQGTNTRVTSEEGVLTLSRHEPYNVSITFTKWCISTLFPTCLWSFICKIRIFNSLDYFLLFHHPASFIISIPGIPGLSNWANWTLPGQPRECFSWQYNTKVKLETSHNHYMHVLMSYQYKWTAMLFQYL